MDTNIVDVEKSLKIIKANIRRKIFTKNGHSLSSDLVKRMVGEFESGTAEIDRTN